MQTLQDEGGEGPGAAPAAGTEGLDPHPHQVARVELLGGGWSKPIGYCPQFEHTRSVRIGEIEFSRIDAQEFFFDHAATVLVVQGMMLQDFFSSDVYFQSALDGHVFDHGPFIFLKGALSSFASPPLRLKNMVLARVTSMPKDMTRTELLGALLRAIS